MNLEQYSSQPTNLNYFLFTLLQFSRLFSVILLWRRYGRFFVDFDSVDRAVDSQSSRLAVDSVDFVDRMVDKIEVDFVANVYEALETRIAIANDIARPLVQSILGPAIVNNIIDNELMTLQST